MYQEVKEEKRRRDDVLSFVIREEAPTTAVYKQKAAATMPLKNFLKGTTPIIVDIIILIIVGPK